MKITAGTILLAVAVFQEYIASIISVEPVPTTLAELFPEYERYGYLPPVKIFTNHATTMTPAFTQIYNHILHRPNNDPPFLARGHVIFAWKGYDRSGNNDPYKEHIAPLWQLFPSLGHEKPWVFETIHNHWVTLNQNEFDKLGFGYILTLVAVQQQTARIYRLTHRDPAVNARANHIAYSRANQAINLLQAAEAEKIHSGQTSAGDSAELIRSRYREAYDLVFREIVHESG